MQLHGLAILLPEIDLIRETHLRVGSKMWFQISHFRQKDLQTLEQGPQNVSFHPSF